MAPKARKRSPNLKNYSEFSPPGYPEDIFPLVLTSATQELFNCRIDEDVTEKSPFKLLKKDDIIDDMKRRAAVSDFSPVKQTVLAYPEEEMLLVFDSNLTYGQFFYLVLTPESKDRILKVSMQFFLCSLLSQNMFSLPFYNKNISYLSLKLRVDRAVQSKVCFSDRDCAESKDSHLECTSYEDSKFKIKKLLTDCGVQAVPMIQTNSCQTMRFWPLSRKQIERQFSTEEKETILKEQSLMNFCNAQIPRMLFALQQEEIINVFLDDWKALATGLEACDWSGQVSDTLVLHQVFTDQKFAKSKTISCLNWHPTIHGKVQHFKAIKLLSSHQEQKSNAKML
uniref:WD repeat domain 63 n=1 Tax=Xiphophorus couchianus TaxID=32473 RepID=A0A3B5LKQ9_9TELE